MENTLHQSCILVVNLAMWCDLCCSSIGFQVQQDPYGPLDPHSHARCPPSHTRCLLFEVLTVIYELFLGRPFYVSSLINSRVLCTQLFRCVLNK